MRAYDCKWRKTEGVSGQHPREREAASRFHGGGSGTFTMGTHHRLRHEDEADRYTSNQVSDEPADVVMQDPLRGR